MEPVRKSSLARLFSRKRWRVLQRALHIRRIHHPRWSFGWSLPFGEWCYFEARTRGKIEISPARWERCSRESYHDCTTTGRY